jgi:hypothetical protein
MLLVSALGLVLLGGTWAVREALSAAAGGPAGPVPAAARLFDAVLECSHPFYLIAVDESPGQVGELLLRLGVFGLLWGCLGVVLMVLAGRLLRPVYLVQLEKAGGQPRRARAGPRRPPVGDDPLCWRERWLEGVAPPGVFRRVPHWLGLFMTAAATALLAQWEFSGVRTSFGWPLLLHSLAAASVFGLLVSLRACAAMVVEKQRNTFEPLMLTDWTYGQVVNSVCRGILLAYLPYLICYSLTALVVAAFHGPEAVALTLGFVPLVWQTVLWLGLCGLEASRGETSMLRSLFSTVILGGLSLGAVAYFWILMVGATWGTFAAIGGGPPSLFGKAGLALAVFTVTTVAAIIVPYFTARGYFRRLEWKANRSKEYQRTLRQARDRVDVRRQ